VSMDKEKKEDEKPIVALDDADITILKTYVCDLALLFCEDVPGDGAFSHFLFFSPFFFFFFFFFLVFRVLGLIVIRLKLLKMPLRVLRKRYLRLLE
jgi:hypothetical protein